MKPESITERILSLVPDGAQFVIMWIFQGKYWSLTLVRKGPRFVKEETQHLIQPTQWEPNFVDEVESATIYYHKEVVTVSQKPVTHHINL